MPEANDQYEFKVYIALPISKHPRGRQGAVDDSRRAQRWLESYGLTVLNPFVVVPNLWRGDIHSEPEWQYYMRRCLRDGLLQADGVAALEGWTSSPGANLEIEIASKLGVPVLSVERWALLARDTGVLQLHRIMSWRHRKG